MAFLLAVLAGIGVVTFFGTVAGSMADFLTVDALDLGLVRLAFNLLLFAVLLMCQSRIHQMRRSGSIY